MAVTLADLTRWRDDLIEARMSGVREVTDSNGEGVRYASDREMASAIASADRMIAGLTRAAPNVIHFRTSKGLDR